MRMKKLPRAKKSRRAPQSPFATLAARFSSAKKGRASRLQPGAIALIVAVFCIGVGAMFSAALHTRAHAETTVASTMPKSGPAPVEAVSTRWTPDETAPPSTSVTTTPQTAVTITGCLEQDDETFRLKNTSGAELPKSRSWKSGFLRKNPRSIEVVDASNRAQLTSHVGQRVVVTGTLVDREMQVRSLRSVASSCKQSA
jgi:hypothetical protein